MCSVQSVSGRTTAFTVGQGAVGGGTTGVLPAVAVAVWGVPAVAETAVAAMVGEVVEAPVVVAALAQAARRGRRG
jgi:hypothetical protein